jgi:hypothetical protein
MNRMFVTLIVFVVFAASASAQAVSALAAAKPLDKPLLPPKGPPTGTTRVAVFNIGLVFAKYDRVTAIREEGVREVKGFQNEAVELAQNLKVWQAALQKNDLGAAKKEQLEDQVIEGRRRLEDLERQARARLGKAHDVKLTVLWKDIREATKTYAAEHGIDLIIAYGDPSEPQLVDVMPNINRKMQGIDQGGSMPFFVSPNADISEPLIELLNRRYRERNADAAEEQERK